MVVNSASVAVAMVLSMFGTSRFEPGAVSRRATAEPVQLAAAAKLWAPKKSKPKGSNGDDEGDSAKEEEVLKPRNPTPASTTPPRPRRRIKMEQPAASDDEAEDADDEGDDEDDQPKITKKRKKVADEDDEDEEEDVPLPSLPVVRPRLVAFEVGAASLGRSFKYNTPLQSDSAIGRVGFQLALESFPLLRTPPGFHRRFGVGASFERETGTAGKYVMSDGSTVSYPMTQGRWGFDLRYFFPIGPRVVLIPAVGYGKSSADLGRRTAVAPSTCTTDFAQPCFPSANPSYLSADLHLRVAATPVIGLSLVAGYLVGLGVQKGDGQISSTEATASMQGFHVDAGASFLITDWFAIQATIPVRRYLYTFAPTAGGAATYRSAADMYYGLYTGVVVQAP